VQMVLTSLGLGGMSNENYERVIAALETPVQRLLPRGPDAIIQTGIPPLVYHGWGIEEELRARVAKLTPTPYITDAAASIAAMRVLGISRVVVVSAFDDELARLIEAYLRHAGIEMLDHRSVYADGDDRESGAFSLGFVSETARTVYGPHADSTDGIWITQASLPSVGVIAELESGLGVPVVSSAQALMWAGLRLAGISDPVEGFGRLFDVAAIDY
jgi:maleate cis-trans isomerase